MKTTAKSITASVAGLALLAVAAYPGPSAAAGGATAPVQLAQMSQQLAHMSQGQGGGPGAMGQGMGTGAMGPGAMGQGMGPGAMGRGFMGQGMGRGTMGQGMMPMMMMMRMHRAMMGRGMMGQGMMGRGFANHGMRVTPSLNITVKDVRRFLEKRLEWMGNKRLKVGAIKKADDDTITADIVTVDDSLVQRFTIDRATGWMHKAK